MSIEANKDFARRYFAIELKEYQEIVEGKKLDKWFAPGFVFHYTAGDLDLKAYSSYVTNYLTSFPDFKFEVQDLISEKDKVVARYIIKGTHTAPFRGIPASGKKININCMMILRLSGGKLAEAWSLIDTFGAMQQIRAIPTPPAKK